LWITNIALLLGAEVNAELDHSKAIAAGLPPDAEPFAEVRDTRKLDDHEKREVEETARQRTDHD
jgi:membrane protein